MTDLEKTNSAVYRLFSNRNNVVRRTDRVWAGLSTSTDLVTEQVLMRSVQSVVGMAGGRGRANLRELSGFYLCQ